MSGTLQQPAIDQPARVSVIQWLLAGSTVLLAAASTAADSHDNLSIALWFAFGGSVILTVSTFNEALRQRLIGKLLLMVGVLGFFWVDGLAAATQDIPFPVHTDYGGGVGQYAVAVVRQTILQVAVFQASLLVGYSVRPRLRRFLSGATRRLDAGGPIAGLSRYCLAVSGFIPLLLATRFDVGKATDVLLAARSGASIATDDPGLLGRLSFFGMYGAGVFVMWAVLGRRRSLRFYQILLAFVVSLPFILASARHLFVFVAMPTVAGVLLAYRGHMTGRRSVKWLGIVLLVLIIAQVQFAVRSRGWRMIGEVRLSEILQPDVAGQFEAILFANVLVPGTHDYFLEPMTPYFLYHFIPRKIWPSKPIPESWDYYNASYTQGGAYNVTPSVIGQYHINWGMIGVIWIGIWLGFVTVTIDRVVQRLDVARQSALVGAAGSVYAFVLASFRFYHPLYFVYVVFALIATWLITARPRPVASATMRRAV